jgi:hypothetical protein
VTTDQRAGCGNWKPKHGIGPYCANCGFHEEEHRDTYPYTRAHPQRTQVSSVYLRAERAAKDAEMVPSNLELIAVLRGHVNLPGNPYWAAADTIERLTKERDTYARCEALAIEERERLRAELKKATDELHFHFGESPPDETTPVRCEHSDNGKHECMHCDAIW